jgi:two-component system, sensor histidine kinase
MARILIVDHVRDSVRQLASFSSGEGYEVLTASNGPDALEAAARDRPDLVLLDMMMPGMDGVEVCRRLKADPAVREIPVIMISAKEMTEEIVEGLDAGAIGYVPKPFNWPIMATRIRSALRIKEFHDTIKLMNVDLVKARGHAKRASQATSRFLANISYKTRTQMTDVLGMAQLLDDTDLDDEQRGHVKTVRSSSEALLHMINDILDLSKIEAGELELEEVDYSLRETVENAVALFAAKAGEKKIALSCLINSDVPDMLRGDPNRLRQILANLVGNAVKFTRKGEINVKIALSGGKDGAATTGPAHRPSLCFSVKDTGIGISKEGSGRLFNSFSQDDDMMSSRYGGTGLGLAICSQLVTLAGGTISAESEQGKGSTFRFVLPLREAGVQDETLPRVGDRPLPRESLRNRLSGQ